MLQCRCFKHEQVVVVKGLRSSLCQREHWATGQGLCLPHRGRNGSAVVQVCDTGMVWWSLATTPAPGSSAQFSNSNRTNSD